MIPRVFRICEPPMTVRRARSVRQIAVVKSSNFVVTGGMLSVSSSILEHVNTQSWLAGWEQSQARDGASCDAVSIW